MTNKWEGQEAIHSVLISAHMSRVSDRRWLDTAGLEMYRHKRSSLARSLSFVAMFKLAPVELVESTTIGLKVCKG